MQTRLTLVALPNAPSFAREFTRSALSHLPPTLRAVAETAELLVSELVTNAVEAWGLEMTTPVSVVSRRHFIQLTFSIRSSGLLIEVWDAVDDKPTRKTVDSDDENGRGLLLVGMLSERWGAVPSPRGGKTVRCVLTPATAAPTEQRAVEASPPRPLPRRTGRRDLIPYIPVPPRSTPPLGVEDMERVLVGLTRLR